MTFFCKKLRIFFAKTLSYFKPYSLVTLPHNIYQLWLFREKLSSFAPKMLNFHFFVFTAAQYLPIIWFLPQKLSFTPKILFFFTEYGFYCLPTFAMNYIIFSWKTFKLSFFCIFLSQHFTITRFSWKTPFLPEKHEIFFFSQAIAYIACQQPRITQWARSWDQIHRPCIITRWPRWWPLVP